MWARETVCCGDSSTKRSQVWREIIDGCTPTSSAFPPAKKQVIIRVDEPACILVHLLELITDGEVPTRLDRAWRSEGTGTNGSVDGDEESEDEDDEMDGSESSNAGISTYSEKQSAAARRRNDAESELSGLAPGGKSI